MRCQRKDIHVLARSTLNYCWQTNTASHSDKEIPADTSIKYLISGFFFIFMHQTLSLY